MIEAYIDKQEWKEFFKDWQITDCAIRSPKFVCALARKRLSQSESRGLDDSEIPRRYLKIMLERAEGQRSGHADLIGYPDPVIGTCTLPIAQDIIASINGHAYANGAGQDGMEEPRDHENNGVVPTRIKQIAGYAFIVGTSRDVIKRTAPGQWSPFNREGIPATQRHFPNGALESSQYTSSQGFNDIDGPSEQLLYAVGGKGDVWRYDGRRWAQCDFPSNEQLNTVTVAPDGTVYISGEGGNLWIGSEDSWRLAARGESSVLFNDSVWFQDQLWLCSDYQLLVWNGEALVRPRHRGEVVAYTGHMDARDGLLLIAAGAYAHCFDGTDWRCLVAPYK